MRTIKKLSACCHDAPDTVTGELKPRSEEKDTPQATGFQLNSAWPYSRGARRTVYPSGGCTCLLIALRVTSNGAPAVGRAPHLARSLGMEPILARGRLVDQACRTTPSTNQPAVAKPFVHRGQTNAPQPSDTRQPCFCSGSHSSLPQPSRSYKPSISSLLRLAGPSVIRVFHSPIGCAADHIRASKYDAKLAPGEEKNGA